MAHEREKANALVAGAIAAVLRGLLHAPWFVSYAGGLERQIRFVDANVTLALAAMAIVAPMYLLVRLFASIWLGARTLAWRTPAQAHVHGLVVLAITGIAVFAIVPRLPDHLLLLSRDTGGFWLLGGLVLAQIAIRYVAVYPELAAKQGWPVPREPRVRKKRERPLVDAPLPPPPVGVEGDPFREPGANEVPLVKRPHTEPAPRVDDDRAPGPKILR